MKDGTKVLIAVFIIVLVFGGLTAAAYLQGPVTTIFSPPPQEPSDFIEIPTMTVPLFSEYDDTGGSLTIGMHLYVEQGSDIDPNYFIGSINETIRNLDINTVNAPGSVEYVQDAIRNTLNDQTEFDVAGVYISDMNTLNLPSFMIPLLFPEQE